MSLLELRSNTVEIQFEQQAYSLPLREKKQIEAFFSKNISFIKMCPVPK
jgi:hypothetical protein